MNGPLLLRAAGVWCVILAAAFVNGGLRDTIVAPRVGTFKAQLIGVAFLGTVICVAAYVFLRATAVPYAPRDLWAVGVLWLLMTLTFEFGFFHFVMGKPWAELLADYNVLEGRLWSVVLLVTALAPRLAGALAQR